MSLRCRCDDIRLVDADIDTMERIRTRLSSISGRNSNIDTSLNNLASSVERTLSATTVPTLGSKIRHLNDDVSSTTSTIETSVRREISALRAERRRLLRLDGEFYRWQRAQQAGHHR